MNSLKEGLTPLSHIIGKKRTSDTNPRTTFVFDIVKLPDTYPISEVGVHEQRIHRLLAASGVGEAIFTPGDKIEFHRIGALSPQDHGIDPTFVPSRHSSTWSRTTIPLGEVDSDQTPSAKQIARAIDHT